MNELLVRAATVLYFKVLKRMLFPLPKGLFVNFSYWQPWQSLTQPNKVMVNLLNVLRQSVKINVKNVFESCMFLWM